MSEEYLERLARLHQRRLTPLPQDPPAPEAREGLPLPAALLTMPEQLHALQTQIAALQQQVAALTHLLQPHAQPPVSPAPSAQQNRTRRRSSTPASPAPRSRPTATTPPKPAHVIARVEYGGEGRYVVICPKKGLLPLEPDTPQWFAWLAEQSSFRFVGKGGHFSAHHEWRVPKGAWRAHRKIRNRGYHLRLAPTQELTMTVLEQAAEALQARLK